MVTHLSAVRVVMTEEIGLYGFECATDCQMVNGEIGRVGDGACGGKPKLGRQHSGKCGKDVFRLACARDALVEVAEQHGRHGAVGLEQRRKMSQVGQMVVPRSAIAMAAADMSIAPRNADTNKMNRTAWRIGGASHKSARRQKWRAERVHVSPRITAPQENLTASRHNSISVVGVGSDDVPAIGQDICITLGDTDNMAG